MKIGIDARFVGPEGTGLGKYTEKLIENLEKADANNQYIIFLKKSNWDYLSLNNKNFKKVVANVSWYTIAEQLRMPGILKSQNLDLLHVPHFNIPAFYKGKIVVTIHDLIHHNFQETSATTKNPIIFKTKRFAYRKIIKKAILKSSHILTPSNYVKEEIVKTFKIDKSKVTVTYEAAEEEYLLTRHPEQSEGPQISNLLEKYSIKKPFLIYVGNAYPHKNLENLLLALKILDTKYKIQDTNLVIVCSRDVFAQRLNEKIKGLNLKGHVMTTGYIDSGGLSSIFRQAEAYVFPSLSEGFGIPGLNAMASGLPVIASNIPVLQEVYGDAAYYFDPKDPKDIAAKIKKVLSSPKIRSGLVAKGNEQVKKYSWLQMAKETLEVYKQAT